MYRDLIVPMLDIPGANLIGPIQTLANAFIQEGGNLKEIWVSREIYDLLSLQITAIDHYISGKKPDAKWTNGLIVINTPTGKVKIRRVDED